MSCHGEHNENGSAHKHSPLKHMLHMVICCGLPILIIFLLPSIAAISPAVAGVLGVIAPFICPVMMGGMMFMMFRGGKKANAVEQTNQTIDKIEE